MKFRNAVKRIAVALVFVPLIIFAIDSDDIDMGIILLSLIIITSFLCGLELLSFGKSKGAKAYPAIVSTTAVSINLFTFLSLKNIIQIDYFYLIIIILLIGIFLLFIVSVFDSNMQNKFECLSINIFSIIYPALFTNFILILKYEYNPWFLFYVFLISWGGDGGAYFIGSFFGKNKLNLPHSPNKTIEGYLGGFITALLTALMISKLIAPAGSFKGFLFSNIFIEIIFILFISLMSFTGDLLESAIKRGVGRKDSYKILKLSGHGGFLDVVDSLVFAFPITYLLLKLFEYIT